MAAATAAPSGEKQDGEAADAAALSPGAGEPAEAAAATAASLDAEKVRRAVLRAMSRRPDRVGASSAVEVVGMRGTCG
jgi:hypothetical protein